MQNRQRTKDKTERVYSQKIGRICRLYKTVLNKMMTTQI